MRVRVCVCVRERNPTAQAIRHPHSEAKMKSHSSTEKWRIFASAEKRPICLDLGSGLIKCGFAGEASPRCELKKYLNHTFLSELILEIGCRICI